MSLCLRPQRTCRAVGIGEAIYRRARVLQHGRPQVRQGRILFGSLSVLPMRESLEAAAGQQAGNVFVAMGGAKTAAEEHETVVENRSTVGIQRIIAASKLINELGI